MVNRKMATYIQPALLIVKLTAASTILATSNQLTSDGNSLTLDPTTMEQGDGNDAAVKSGSVDWDEFDKW